MIALVVKSLLKILLALSLVAALAGVPLLVSGSFRDQTFRAVAELPAIYYYFRLRGPMISRDFATATRHLDRQLDFTKSFASGRNVMLPGLLSNTAFVVKQATFANDFRTLRPYLERLVAYRQELFPARLWLAEALVETEPEKAFANAEAARRLIPTDERPYRLAIEAALRTNQVHRIREICQRYRKANLGAYHFFDFNTLFSGSGLREFGLETTDGAGKTAIFKSPGPNVGEDITYTFQFDKPISVAKLRLHFSTPPGVVFRVLGLRFFLGGTLHQEIAENDFVVSSRRGFHTAQGIATIAREGEALSIHTKALSEHLSDQVRVRLSVSRLDILAGAACKAKG